MGDPSVTVLMTVYNGGKYLKESVRSVLSQTFEDFEFLIINDCSTDDSVKIIESFNDERLKFLYESGLGNTKMKVIIRCHPAAPYETFKKYIDFKMPDNFIIDNQKSIQEELSDTDIVLYTWTTVAIEALKLGLPVIYFDVLDPMYVDPLFKCNALKKSVKKPEELLSAIKDFYNMDDKSFYTEQQIAQEYLKEYFYPVTEDNLASFMPDNK